MYASAVRFMIRLGVSRIDAGDYGPLLASFADDAVLLSGTHYEVNSIYADIGVVG
jgi:hypothetical protein